jgi:DNA-binding beta-propeller fold protein YncE
VYGLNSATKAELHKIQPQAGATGIQAATDSLGELFTGLVIDGTGPIRIFDNTWTYQGNVWDTSRGFSRCLAVNGTGNDVYFAGYTNNAIYHFHSANGSIGPYVLADTALKGMECESMAWNPKTHYLWVSAGNDANAPNQYPGVTTHWQKQTWYAYNTVTKQVVDSLTWKPVTGHEIAGDGARPRGIAFSPGGDTAYVACFNLDSAGVQMFTNVVTSIEPISDVVPANYTLAQNFPNPFNPSTEIQFTVPKAGFTTLKVYDILGRTVATLVNEDMNPGTFKVTLDGKNLSSGTYIYTLQAGDARITKKMMLLK